MGLFCLAISRLFPRVSRIDSVVRVYGPSLLMRCHRSRYPIRPCGVIVLYWTAPLDVQKGCC